ncbi:spore germination protein [Paenibacillus humicola]|uniref:spore germination protein n=1 Tax=Paenibacillus humicola TaxID=3110540 RepID=UPI00237BAC58|nr:spore germination protein [Paenibacillus humicola]
MHGSKRESQDGSAEPGQPLSRSLRVNLEALQAVFEDAGDIVIREFKIGAEIEAFVIFIAGLVNQSLLYEHFLGALMTDMNEAPLRLDKDRGDPLRHIKESVLTVAGLYEAKTLQETVLAVLNGDTALFVEGTDNALVASIRGSETRNVGEPDTEVTVRGPREGFVESIQTNSTLLRRKIKSADLKFEPMRIGTITKTDIYVVYLKGIAADGVVREVKQRLAKIETDSILESGYVESFIEDAPFSLFGTVGNSEKPDIVSAKLLEGRVAILIDGTPFVLTVPYLFVEAFQNSEDYYSRPYYATFIRSLRWFAFMLSVFLPSAYVAVTTFHQELLPSRLLISIAASKEGTPFPAIIEALMMQIIFEILREAGIRLPRPVGQTVSIVGALVLGEAAVSAGLIGAPMVIVVSLTAISSFVVPALTDALSIARLILIVLAGFAGQFGIMLGIAGILTHLCSLRSVGVPYLTPLTPARLSDMKDVWIRAPWWAMRKRPLGLETKDKIRQTKGRMPRPPEDDASY